MSTNELKPIVISNSSSRSDLLLNTMQLDLLTSEILRFYSEKLRYPKKIIFNEEMAQRYFDHYTQGNSYMVSFDKKPIEFVVNIRLRSAELIMM